jgi:hypothetical protein
VRITRKSKLETPVLSLEEAKVWLRLVSSREDTLVNAMCIAAQDRVEDYTGLALSEQEFEFGIYNWPDFDLVLNHVNGNSFPAHQPSRPSRMMVLPRSPLAEVVKIEYLDQGGDRVEVDESNYSAIIDSRPSLLTFSPDFDLPELVKSSAGERVFITFKANLSDGDVSTLEVAKVAIRYAVSHWFNNRNPHVVGASVNKLPGTSEDLLRSLRIDRPFYT